MSSGGPLAGVRVVDLTAMVMGPYCTQIMADMGADVVKIEPPQGDDTRYISVGPAPGMSGVFVNVNRGKRGIAIDLKSDAGRTALRALIERADVFIHSMRAKAIARLGFSYTDVAAINPAIVYTNCYGYGRRGPNRDLPAYDDTIQAACGLPSVQEQLTGEANFVGTILADKVAGLTALYATMMALFHRERTGEGQEVEIGMFEAMASFMLVEHANGAMFDPPLGPAVYPRTVAPNRRPYRTSDGYIAALIYNDKHWAAFIDAVRPPWTSDLYATLEGRARQIDTVYSLLAETFARRTTDEWLKLLRELEIPASPISSPAALFDDEQLEAVGFFETVDSPHGPVRFPGVPTWFSRTPGRVAGPAPELGAHTDEVLDELGLRSAEANPA
ncbi:CaiB/BaiF CoA transferase family protein [Mycobacterium asiaticum]|uniref:CaiB/BaiF CoA transferase family protein n=1 Tax=Mycobacterium asiaticum TaxID=1790 RepID=UPI0007EFB1E2|nr:CoA transferase [Mycobacterium asiaticum]OBJ47393.1 acetyl-CoA acetyltransferase [Mycobacterium asiaticum]